MFRRAFRNPFPFRSVTLKLTRPKHCPRCRAAITDIGESGPAAPQPGGFTICWQCDEFLRFDKNLNLQQLTDADKRVLDCSPQTVRELDQLRIAIAVQRQEGRFA